MGKRIILLGILMVIIHMPVPVYAVMMSSVNKNSITWTFDKEYECGQFINGDWWVLDPGSGVTVTSVSPLPEGSGISFRNGSEINPIAHGDYRSGFDGRVSSFDSSLSTTLPVVLNSNDSLVSTISAPLLNIDKDVYGADVLFDYMDVWMHNPRGTEQGVVNYILAGRQRSRFNEVMWDTYRADYGPIWVGPNTTTPPDTVLGANLLEDPGFENDGQGWSEIDRYYVRTDPNPVTVHSGTKALQFIDLGSIGRLFEAYQDVTGIVATEEYYLQVWVNLHQIQGATVTLHWFNTTDDPIGSEDICDIGYLFGNNTRSESLEWTKFSGNYIAPVGAVKARIAFV